MSSIEELNNAALIPLYCSQAHIPFQYQREKKKKRNDIPEQEKRRGMIR